MRRTLIVALVLGLALHPGPVQAVKSLREAGEIAASGEVAPRFWQPWAWSRVDAGGQHPAGREGHAAVEVGNRIYIIGGCVQEIRCYNDVHIFDTDTLSWQQEPITGDGPEPRGGHTASLVGTNIYLFGGASSESTFGDVYKLDLIQKHWSRGVLANGEIAPKRRTNHAATAEEHGRIYIFGGYDADGNFLDDTWILNVYGNSAAPPGQWQDAGTFLAVWEKPTPSGIAPSPRESHSLTLVDRRLVLFGGYTSSGQIVNDVHTFNLDTQSWSVVPVGGEKPAPRQSMSAARHGKDVVVAGGCDVAEESPVCFNDVWSLDTVGMRWTKRAWDVVSWFPREGHSATFVRGRMFMFGGCQLSAECYNDVSVLETLDPCPSSCGGHGECKAGKFCQCSIGFTGHDCMAPLTCPRDCSGHGQCAQTGKCSCDNGWTGDACAVELPCPGAPYKCSSQGTCRTDGTCACFSGYSGEDCSQGQAACPDGCSAHGSCRPDATCACHEGWTGPGCATRLVLLEDRCPHDCCGHGTCSAQGCTCAAGWFGPACAANQSTSEVLDGIRHTKSEALLQEAQAKRRQAEKSRFLAEVMERSGDQRASMFAQAQQLHADVRSLTDAAEDLVRRADNFRKGRADVEIFGNGALTCAPEASLLAKAEDVHPNASMLAVKNTEERQKAASHQESEGPIRGQKMEPPTGKDFGVEAVNSEGHTGIEAPECPDNCNFRGVCDKSRCFCQPGYYGPTCGSVKDDQKGTISLGMVLIIAAACIGVSFLFTLILLHVTESAKRMSEKKLGYNV